MLFAVCRDDGKNRLVWPRLWAIRLARLPKRIGRPRSTVSRASRATSCRAGAIRRFTPEPINCAGGVKHGVESIEPYGPSRCRPARGRVDPGANFQLAQGRKRTSPAGRGLRDDHLESTGQRNRPSSYGVTSRAITNAAARADRDLARIAIQGSRLSIHERPKHVEARTEGGHLEGDLIICKRTRPVLSSP